MEERQEKLEKQHASIRSLHKIVQHLKSKIAKLTDQVGFHLSEETTSDLSVIMEGGNANVQALHLEGSIQRLFWGQQYEAAQHNKACSMKWHPLYD